jgi:hypothetical protein
MPGCARPGAISIPAEQTEEEGRPRWPSVGELAEAEVLMALPAAPYPATIEVHKIVDDKASVAFRGNRYSVAPGLGAESRSPCGTGSAPRASRSSRPPASSSCRTVWPAPAQGPWCAPRRTGPPSKRWCSPSSAPLVRVTEKPTSRPGRPLGPSGTGCFGGVE